MKNLILISILILGGITCINARQQSPPQTAPVPQNTPNPAEETRRLLLRQQESNRRFEALRNAGEVSKAANIRLYALQNIQPLYREPTKKEMKILEPDQKDLRRFTGFLKQSGTGLTKLIADTGCAENTSVVVVSEECLKYTMPGAGSSYSFRIDNYRIRRLADLTFSDNSFHGFGVLTHSIMVNLGDISLDEVTLKSEGLKYLREFVPVTDFEKAKEIDLSLIKGVEAGGFIFRRSLPALNETTYVLRSIAYKGSFFRVVDGIAYDEIDFDKRKDIIVAFRIIRRNEDGSVTILWKELERKDSPKVKQKVDETETEIKDTKYVARESENQ